MIFKPTLITLLLGCATLAAYAQLTEQFTFNPNFVVPDGNSTGLSDSQLITTSAISSIESVTVDLNISGDFNGDLYVYLRHESEATPGHFVTDGFSVLLNRPGRTGANPNGYSDSGFTITLSDSPGNGDIHVYQSVSTPAAGSPLQGTWQPDGRNINPISVLDTDSRTALLNSFQNDPANGRWTLFAADLQSGGLNQINSWTLNFTAVPEPAAYMTAAALGLLALAVGRRFSK